MNKNVLIGIIVVLVVIVLGVGGYILLSGNSDETNNNNNNNVNNGNNTSNDTQNEGNDNTGVSGSNVLVVYFSAQGHTEAVSEQIAENLGADLFEIVPTDEYTSDDLNWTDSDSRVSRMGGDGHGMHMLRAEMPGPAPGKLVSRMSDTAKILYGIYLVMTIIEILLLVAGGMPLFDSCIHSFGSAGTGGFSCRNLSVGAYNNPYFDIVIGIFMLLFGVNFNLYYFLLVRKFREVFRSEELWAYVIIVAVAVGAITLDIVHLYDSVSTSLRHAFFQVSSIMTTTGYATVDFNTWPTFSKAILVALMFIGGCAGSTAGGLKVARVVILEKVSVSEMRRMLHPNAVSAVRFEGKPLNERSIQGVHLFFAVYMAIFVVSCLLVSLEQMDLVTVFTAVATCINNVGPGLEIVGPMGNFSSFSPLSKLLLSFDMLVGRLEVFPMLLLFAPSIWKRRLPTRRPVDRPNEYL